jgi:protease-4
VRLVLQSVIAFFWLLFLPLKLLRRHWPMKKGTYVLLEIDGAVEDIVAPTRLIDFAELGGKPKATSLHALRDLIDELTGDERVTGVIVILKSFRGGMATATGLRAVLARVPASRRELVIHLPTGAGSKEVYIATAATRIFLGPQAVMAPLGFLTATRYFRGALDKAGLVPEVFAAGKFKSAGEQLARTSMSEGQREQLDAILDRFHGELVGAIASGRRVDEARARALVDEAPYLGEEAARAGLADGAAYEDELPTHIGALVSGGPAVPVLFADRVVRARRATRMRVVLRRRVIGVIPVHGAIAQAGPIRFMPLALDDRIIAAIRVARSSPNVAGVILHVDSPGGSALASDRIHHELVQLAAEKPLVACFSNVAASGGYYVGAAAHFIVAEPTTITGSIGVVAARVIVEPLLARLGVHTDVLKRGARAHLLDATIPFDDADRAALDRELAGIYMAFKSVVATGRRRSLEDVERVAQGRVWTGADALEKGLVDRLGGFDVALDAVRERVGKGGRHLLPVILRAPRKGMTPLNPPVKRAAEILEALARVGAELGLEGLDLDAMAAFGRERVLAWSPFASTDIRG